MIWLTYDAPFGTATPQEKVGALGAEQYRFAVIASERPRRTKPAKRVARAARHRAWFLDSGLEQDLSSDDAQNSRRSELALAAEPNNVQQTQARRAITRGANSFRKL